MEKTYEEKVLFALESIAINLSQVVEELGDIKRALKNIHFDM